MGAVPARFISIEGADGAGKSTQVRLLAASLQAHGLTVLATREPGGAPAAERLRALLLDPDLALTPLAETLLHTAARAEHVARTIRPALEAGNWVVSDRFADSTTAYQGCLDDADPAAITTLRGLIGLRPDLTIILDVALDTALSRAARRGAAADRYERRGRDFLACVRDRFRAIAAAEPARCALIAADGPEAVVADEIIRIVRRRFALA